MLTPRDLTAEALRNARENQQVNKLFIENYRHIAANFHDIDIVHEAYLIATSKTNLTPDNFIAMFGGIYRKQKHLHEIYAPIVLDIGAILAEPIGEQEEQTEEEIKPKTLTKRQVKNILSNAKH